MLCRLLAAAAALAFVAYFGLFCFVQKWGSDFEVYVAAVSRLYQHLLRPTHEALMASGDQTFAYSPYLLVVAALGKLTRVTPYRALQIAGVFNLVFFVAAAGVFFWRHSLHKRWELPLTCFLFVTLFLRWYAFGWSSETSVVNLQYMQSYPSMIAWSLAFIAFALVKSVAETTSRWAIGGLAVSLALLLATHGLTASWAVGIVGVYGLYSAIHARSHWPLTRVLLALVLGVGLSALWPYPPLLSLSSIGSHEGAPFGKSPFKDFLNLYWVALPCAIYLYGRLGKHDVWLLGFGATLGALFVWRRLGVDYGNRYSLFAAFFAQFGVAEMMAFGLFAIARPLGELPPNRKFPALDRPIALCLLAAALLAWIPSPMLAEHRAEIRLPMLDRNELPPHDAYYRRYSGLRRFLGEDDIVIMRSEHAVFDLASLTRAHFVVCPYMVRVPDAAEREQDVRAFFDGDTSVEARTEIIERRSITRALLRRDQFALLPSFQAEFGAPLYEDGDRALFAVSAS